MTRNIFCNDSAKPIKKSFGILSLIPFEYVSSPVAPLTTASAERSLFSKTLKPKHNFQHENTAIEINGKTYVHACHATQGLTKLLPFFCPKRFKSQDPEAAPGISVYSVTL